MHYWDSLTGLIWTALGAFGGIVKVLVQLLRMTPLPPRSQIFWLIFANSLISGFAGFMGATFVSNISPSDDIHIIAAGVSGYLGVATLDLLSEWFKGKIKKGDGYLPSVTDK